MEFEYYLCHIDYNIADTGHGRFQRPGRYGTHCPGSHNSVVHPGNLKQINKVNMRSRFKQYIDVSIVINLFEYQYILNVEQLTDC